MDESIVRKYKDILCFLSCQDCAERLNNLVYEIRHLQENIIYTLRSPKLYRILRYEEKNCLFKEELSLEKINKISDINERVNEWILDFPRLREGLQSFNGGNNGNNQEVNKLRRSMVEFVVQQWLQARWTEEEQRYYLILCSSQLLKRNIVRDKLFLLHEGVKFFLASKKSDSNDTFLTGRFFMLRSAILGRTRDYVERLGDYQAQFSKAQDVGLQDHPRPSMERRREQRFYNSYLAVRCRQAWLELERIGSKGNLFFSKNQKNIIQNMEKARPLIMHRWQHKAASIAESIYDTTQKQDDSFYGYGAHFINSSFFMPDRPDLQPLLAHEIAHTIIRDHFNDLMQQSLFKSGGSFAALLMRIRQCLDSFQAEIFQQIPTKPDHILKEIATDLLAVALQGYSYVYALFLEIVGSGLEVLFRISPHADINLDIIQYLEKTAGLRHLPPHFWYIRLHVICAFIKEINIYSNSAKDELGKNVIMAISAIADDLIKYLDELTDVYKPNFPYWNNLKTRLCKIVETSKAAQDIRTFLHEQHKDYYQKKHTEPFSTRPLNFYGRMLVLKLFSNDVNNEFKKSEGDKNDFNGITQNLADYKNDLDSIFAEDAEKKLRKIFAEDRLFEFHTDIGWQYGIIKGELLTEKIKNNTELSEINLDNNIRSFLDPVREMHQYALDFYMHDIEPPSDPLEEICRLMLEDKIWNQMIRDGYFHGNSLKDASEKIFYNDFTKNFFEWYNHTTPKLKFSDDVDFVSSRKPEHSIIEATHDDGLPTITMPKITLDSLPELKKAGKELIEAVEGKFSLASLCKKYSAEEIILANHLVKDHELKRQLYDLQIEKINLFLGIIPNEKEFSFLTELVSYLHIVLPKYTSNQIGQKEFYKTIYNGFQHDDMTTTSYILGKVSTGSVYDVDKHPSADKANQNKKRHSDLGMECLSHPTDDGEEKYYNATGLIGRYDIFLQREVSEGKLFALPKFDCMPNQKDIVKEGLELFFPFFIRWELGLPVKLGKKWYDPDDPDPNKPPVLAFISVILANTSSRLDFLSRILKVSDQQKMESINSLPESEIAILFEMFDLEYPMSYLFPNDNPSRISELKGYFTEYDQAFLTDGWEDILFVLRGDPSRLEDIFQIQKVLYEDFQVDRTEIILTFKALDYAALYPEKVRIKTMVRLMDEGSLGGVDNMFTKVISHNYKKLRKEDKNGIPEFCHEFDLSRTPGRMDYSLRIHPVMNDNVRKKLEKKIHEEKESPVLHPRITSIFRNTYIDRLQTNLGLCELPQKADDNMLSDQYMDELTTIASKQNISVDKLVEKLLEDYKKCK